MNTDGEDAGGSFDRVEVYRGDQRRASRSADPDAEHDPAAAALAQGFQDHSAKPSQRIPTDWCTVIARLPARVLPPTLGSQSSMVRARSTCSRALPDF